jgi:hypothetical protein
VTFGAAMPTAVASATVRIRTVRVIIVSLRTR